MRVNYENIINTWQRKIQGQSIGRTGILSKQTNNILLSDNEPADEKLRGHKKVRSEVSRVTVASPVLKFLQHRIWIS